MKLINKLNKYYIVAPANFATGGPELLHQLAYKLKRNGKSVSMWYIPTDNPSPVHENYRQYAIDYVREIKDEEHSVLIVPEVETPLLKNFKKIKKIIWWLSVDNYFHSLGGLKGKINRFILYRLNSQNYFFFNRQLKYAAFHLAQSEYARVFLNKNGVNNVGVLGDYLHESFLNVQVDEKLKQDIVAYNPKKGYNFTKKLINKSPNIKYVPIENMSREDVVELLKKAKVYIDFGFHPGKDRIPREAAYLKCCVISNKRGSANFSKDVPIGEDFKFEESIHNLNLIIQKIEDCFNNYTENLANFDFYRRDIKNQEYDFDEQIRKFF